ncbi:DNA repair protein XRCC4 [Condylostylus longicornis]|uniref:DNA repair protein XRCC4 n=1 Tax=Condylostylus longicornis TaxID=2530218 RepID=UPI00244E0FF6|nr:DNA repair protein XRCC4 [Condylostylus longicornis]
MACCEINETHISKLPANNNYIYVLSDWSGKNIGVKVLETQGLKKWFGTITEETMHASAKDLSMNLTDFKDECKLALTTNKGREGFNYILEDGKFKLQKCKRFKTTYFEIEVLETFEEFKMMLLDYSLDINENLIALLSKKDETLNTFKTEMNNLIAKYQKCKAEKDDMEITLFSKFALLLNSKKNRIIKLENILKTEGISVKYNSKRKISDESTTIKNDDDEFDLFENNSDNAIFDAQTQVITPEETQTLNILNLPKRQKIVESLEQNTSDEFSCKKVKSLEKHPFQSCKDIATTSSGMSPILRRENSSEDYFAKIKFEFESDMNC